MPAAKPFRVDWADSAIRDVEAIHQYILDQDEQAAADRFVEGVYESVSRLAEFPNSGRIVPEMKACNIDLYREIVHLRWRIIYVVHVNRVSIARVVDGSRNLPEVLRELGMYRG